MKISFNWLKEISGCNLPVEKVCEILTNTGLEVEGIESFEAVKGNLEGVIVAEVVECDKLADSDHLNITKVNTGTEVLQVVCGAPNVEKGQKVLLATIGTTLHPTPNEDFKIKKSKIRGIESFGMLCAEDELGLGHSHEGILVLPSETKTGMPASTYFGFETDVQIEIGLTPNRADAMGHYGVARDLVAYLNAIQGEQLHLKEIQRKEIIADNQNRVIDVVIENEAACNRYIGITLSNVKIAPSPNWLQNRLRTIGLSPINNVVDATNYVMRELGTPLHAFDADKVGTKVVVKNAKEGDKFTTLDGVERTLSEKDLMITNGSHYLALAGVFGGQTSGVSEETTTLFIESAYFNPVSVRKSAKRHQLNTDASFRYERGVDPELTKAALERVVALIQELAGGNISMDVKEVYPTKIDSVQVNFTYENCKKIIGKEIPKEIIKAILINLDIQLLKETSDQLTIQIPPYRVDVTREIDVIEEVLRIYGLNSIELPAKLNTSLTHANLPDKDRIRTTLTEFMVGLGYSEMMNNSLTSSEYGKEYECNAFHANENVVLLNPLSNELDVMRQSLLFGALESVVRNQNRQQNRIKLFEFGKTYKKVEEDYIENHRLLIVLSGALQDEIWNSNQRDASFFTLKGIVHSLFTRMGLANFWKESPFDSSLLSDGLQIDILKKTVGQIGFVSRKMRKDFGIKNDVFIADLDWDALIASLKMVKHQYKPLPKTFESRRDFSLLLDKNSSFASIFEIAKNTEKRILKSVNLFDVYEGEKIGEDKKSYAVSFYFQDGENTLKDQQIDQVMQKIQQRLVNELGAELR